MDENLDDHLVVQMGAQMDWRWGELMVLRKDGPTVSMMVLQMGATKAYLMASKMVSSKVSLMVVHLDEQTVHLCLD